MSGRRTAGSCGEARRSSVPGQEAGPLSWAAVRRPAPVTHVRRRSGRGGWADDHRGVPERARAHGCGASIRHPGHSPGRGVRPDRGGCSGDLQGSDRDRERRRHRSHLVQGPPRPGRVADRPGAWSLRVGDHEQRAVDRHRCCRRPANARQSARGRRVRAALLRGCAADHARRVQPWHALRDRPGASGGDRAGSDVARRTRAGGHGRARASS